MLKNLPVHYDLMTCLECLNRFLNVKVVVADFNNEKELLRDCENFTMVISSSTQNCTEYQG